MATSTLLIPSEKLISPMSWGSRQSIKTMLERILYNYGTFITFASENSKLPKSVIASFIAVESGGNSKAGASGHITQGLMQWNRTYAKANLETEYAEKRLTPAEIQKLASFGIKFTNGKTRAITNADQLKPELNILIGSIILGQLADEKWATDSNGSLRLDRMIAVYNAGAYGDTGKKARFGEHLTPYDLAKAVNPTTSGYISKILGKDGAMDILTSDLASKV
jgi:soluble lytic murein transglycosylase-like protein